MLDRYRSEASLAVMLIIAVIWVPHRRVISVPLSKSKRARAGKEKAPRDGARLLGRESEGLGGIG